MLKSIGLLSMLVMAIATTAYLPAGDEDSPETCPATGACQSETKACTGGECPSTKLTSKGEEKSCCSSEKNTSACAGGECPSTKLTSKGEEKSCCSSEKNTSACAGGECPSTKLTSKGEEKSCCSGEKNTSACAGGECPSTKLTSKGEEKSCSGEKCSACTAGGEKCSECPSTKLTSAGEGCPCKGQCTGSCGKHSTVATSAECKDCPVTLAMKKLPQMAYRVGTEDVCCPKAAGELAEKSGGKMHFVVAEKTYDCPDKAKLALVEATEHFVAGFAKPNVCEKSGNITVAGHKACCAGTAAQMAKTAKDAMDKVHMTYVVGEKSCNCPMEAEKLAKDSGDVKLFVVGQEKTACDVTARLNLARAKYKAVVMAMVEATTETKDTSTDS